MGGVNTYLFIHLFMRTQTQRHFVLFIPKLEG